MVKIRLYRTGTTKRPKFRVVAIDERKKRQGRVLEFLGTYEPVKAAAPASLHLEAIDAWVAKGAQLSDTVKSLVKRARSQPADGAAEASA